MLDLLGDGFENKLESACNKNNSRPQHGKIRDKGNYRGDYEVPFTVQSLGFGTGTGQEREEEIKEKQIGLICLYWYVFNKTIQGAGEMNQW